MTKTGANPLARKLTTNKTDEIILHVATPADGAIEDCEETRSSSAERLVRREGQPYRCLSIRSVTY
jgi:hypothetical protein